MDAPWLLDTSVLIEHLRGRPGAAEFFARLPSKPLLSVVSVAEVFAGAGDDEEDRRRLDQFLGSFEVIPLTSDLARTAGLLCRAHGTRLPDAMIAATAQERNATLLTFNLRDFQMLERVQQPYRR